MEKGCVKMAENIPLTKDLIISKAIEILNKDGIDKLSMRGIANILGVTATSIYWHFKNKNELLLYISDEICKRVTYDKINYLPKNELKILLIEYRNVLNSIRDSVIIMQSTPPATDYRQKLINRVIELIIALGVVEDRVFISSMIVNNYVLSFVLDEVSFKQILADNDIEINGLNLPKFNFDLDEEFIKGIDIILDGLELQKTE